MFFYKYFVFVSILLMLGLLWAIIYDAYSKHNSLVFPQTTGVTVVPTHPGYALVVSTISNAPIKCDRFIAHYATSVDDGNVHETIVLNGGTILPLSMTVNAADIIPPPDRFQLHLMLPSGMAPGHWLYRNRIVYFCSIWPGFVSIRAFEVAKIPFDLPPP